MFHARYFTFTRRKNTGGAPSGVTVALILPPPVIWRENESLVILALNLNADGLLYQIIKPHPPSPDVSLLVRIIFT